MSNSNVKFTTCLPSHRVFHNNENNESDSDEPGDCLSTLTNLEIACLPFTLTLTLAVRPTPKLGAINLSGAPVSIGETRSRSLGLDREKVRPPGTGPHVAVRHNRGSDSDAIHSDRSPWRIG
jgi:hypothetical protein